MNTYNTVSISWSQKRSATSVDFVDTQMGPWGQNIYIYMHIHAIYIYLHVALLLLLATTRSYNRICLKLSLLFQMTSYSSFCPFSPSSVRSDTEFSDWITHAPEMIWTYLDTGDQTRYGTITKRKHIFLFNMVLSKASNEGSFSILRPCLFSQEESILKCVDRSSCFFVAQPLTM